MTTVQYAQHDWSPTLAAMVFLTMAIVFVVGMGLSLLAATREQRGTTARHAGGHGHGPLLH
jgi:hypothetical protein